MENAHYKCVLGQSYNGTFWIRIISVHSAVCLQMFEVGDFLLFLRHVQSGKIHLLLQTNKYVFKNHPFFVRKQGGDSIACVT